MLTMLSHRLLSATLCLASTAAASLPPNAALPGAFPPSDCAFLLTDASGASYAYDLTPIAGQNFSISVGPYVYYIATCGISPWACTPSHAESWPYAPLVQSDPKTASGSCWDPAHSTEVPCSDYCEVRLAARCAIAVVVFHDSTQDTPRTAPPTLPRPLHPRSLVRAHPCGTCQTLPMPAS